MNLALQASLRRLTLKQTIDTSAERLWQRLMDPRACAGAHPWIVRCHIHAADGQWPLARRECHLRGGLIWTDQVIEAQEGRRIVLQCLRSSLPLNYARLTMDLVPRSSTASVLRMSMEYRPRYGVFGSVVDQLGLRRMLQHSLHRWAQGISGQAVRSMPVGALLPG